MTKSDNDAQSYLEEVFALDEEEQADTVLELRAEYLKIPLKNPLGYDGLSRAWYNSKEEFEGSLADYWLEDDDERNTLLFDLCHSLETHPYDHFQHYSLRFKWMILNRAEVLSFDKKEYDQIEPRELLDIFWGSKSGVVRAKHKITEGLYLRTKRASYKQLMADFKKSFPELYQMEKDFFAVAEKVAKNSNNKSFKKKRAKNKESFGSSYIWVVCVVLYLAVKACRYF